MKSGVLRQLYNAATPGPWFECKWDPMEPVHISRVDGEHHPNKDIATSVGERDAALIVAVVNALPALLDVVEAAQAVEKNHPAWTPGIVSLAVALDRLENA